MQRRVGFAVATSDGTPLFHSIYEPAGEARATLVFTDGIGCDGYAWKYLLRSLAPSYRIIRWHYRGHGRTPAPRDRERVSMADIADDLAAVLDETETERAVLFGHSMGVQVSLESYRRHADRVAGLVLICGAPGRPLATFRGTAAGARLLPALRYLVDRSPGLFNGLWRTLLPTDLAHWLSKQIEVNGLLLERADFAPYLEGIARVDIQMFLAMLAEAQRHDARDLLPRIAVPSLIIAGDRDGFTPASLSELMHREIPDAELLMIEGGSHTAPLERPHLVDDTVADFLARRIVAR